jgi:hypothetical protein
MNVYKRRKTDSVSFFRSESFDKLIIVFLKELSGILIWPITAPINSLFFGDKKGDLPLEKMLNVDLYHYLERDLKNTQEYGG